MADVVTLHGVPILPAPNESVIETIEELLAKVRSGEVDAVAFAYTLANGGAGTGWDGGAGTRYSLGAAVGMLNTRYHSRLLEG